MGYIIYFYLQCSTESLIFVGSFQLFGFGIGMHRQSVGSLFGLIACVIDMRLYVGIPIWMCWEAGAS